MKYRKSQAKEKKEFFKKEKTREQCKSILSRFPFGSIQCVNLRRQ